MIPSTNFSFRLSFASLLCLSVFTIGQRVAAQPTTLGLEVDTLTGSVNIFNPTTTPVALDAYQIESLSGSLDSNGWFSLQSQGLANWQVVGIPSDFLLIELNPLSTTLFPEDRLSLEMAYDANTDSQDLTFQYGELGNSELTVGFVDYLGINSPLLGDLNADGVVNAQDAAVWALDFGFVFAQSDYDDIFANLGATLGFPPLPDDTPAQLIYNTVTGNLTVDQTSATGGEVQGFHLLSADGQFIAPGTANFPYQETVIEGPETGVTSVDSPGLIGQVDIAVGGLPSDQFSIGPVLPSLSKADFLSDLSGSFYVDASGFANEFELIFVPEPSSVTLGFGALLSCLSVVRPLANRKRAPWL